METIADKLSDKIAIQMNYDDDKKAVITYGLIAIIQMTIIGIAISLIGILGRFFYESFLIFIGVGILKKSSGGAHSQSIYGCTVISILSIVLLSVLSRYVLNFQTKIWITYCIVLVVFAFCLIIFHKYIPVDSPNKPITNPDKIKRLRRQSYIILVIYTITGCLTVCLSKINFRFYSISLCFPLILIWQSFMLTKKAQKVLKHVDMLFLSKGD